MQINIIFGFNATYHCTELIGNDVPWRVNAKAMCGVECILFTFLWAYSDIRIEPLPLEPVRSANQSVHYL